MINPIRGWRRRSSASVHGRFLSHEADGACLKSLSLRHRTGPDGDADWHILADVNGSQGDPSSQASSSPWERKKGRETERAWKDRHRNGEREREGQRGAQKAVVLPMAGVS